MPRALLLSPEEWADLPARLEDPFFRRLHAFNEQACGVMAEQGREDFWRLGGDLRAGTPARSNPWRYRVLKHRLVRFGTSWRLTGAAGSRVEALRAVDALLEAGVWSLQWPGTGLAYADLKTADLTYCACFALEALEPVLSSEQRDGLLTLLIERAMGDYLEGWARFDWWRHAEFNWGASLHGCAGMAALALGEEAPELSQRVLQRVNEGLRYVIDYLPEGGGWPEGMMYQTTTLGHLTDYVAALHRLGGGCLELTRNRRLIANLDFRMWMVGGDGRPLNFSNCNEGSHEWRLPHAYWWAARCERPDWAGFEDAFPRDWFDTHGVFLDLEALWYREPNQPSVAYREPRGLWHAREIDWLSWKEGQTWIGFRSGNNGGNHNNSDLGQVILGHAEERVLCDPGYGAGATHQHSCVTVRGNCTQAPGSQAKIFRAHTFASERQALLYICCDLSACYANWLCYQYRHALVSSDGWLLLIDELLTRHGLRAGAVGHLQFRGEPTEVEGAWYLKDSPGGYHVRFLTPVHRVAVEQWEHGEGAFHTLCYYPKPDYPFARMAALIAPAGTPGASLSIEGTTGVFDLGGLRLHLDFAEGTCSLPLT
jgi:hypothetical protein